MHANRVRLQNSGGWDLSSLQSLPWRKALLPPLRLCWVRPTRLDSCPIADPAYTRSSICCKPSLHALVWPCCKFYSHAWSLWLIYCCKSGLHAFAAGPAYTLCSIPTIAPVALIDPVALLLLRVESGGHSECSLLHRYGCSIDTFALILVWVEQSGRSNCSPGGRSECSPAPPIRLLHGYGRSNTGVSRAKWSHQVLTWWSFRVTCSTDTVAPNALWWSLRLRSPAGVWSNLHVSLEPSHRSFVVSQSCTPPALDPVPPDALSVV